MLTNYNRRKLRVRNKINKNNRSKRPRVVIYRSNKNIHAQLIDNNGDVKAFFYSKSLANFEKNSGMEKARLSGAEFARTCLQASIIKIVFDKGAYAYCGRVEAFAKACRDAGLEF